MKRMIIVSTILAAGGLTLPSVCSAGPVAEREIAHRAAPARLRLVDIGENPTIERVVTEVETISNKKQPEFVHALETFTAPGSRIIEARRAFVGAKGEVPVFDRLQEHESDLLSTAQERETENPGSRSIVFPRARWSPLSSKVAGTMAEAILEHASNHSDSPFNEMKLAQLFDLTTQSKTAHRIEHAASLEPNQIFDPRFVGIAGRKAVKLSSGLVAHAGKVINLQYESLMNPEKKVIKNPYHPMVNVSWYDAQEFIAKAKEEAGIVVRLLTFDEGVEMAQGITPKHWRFPWGHNRNFEIDENAVYIGNSNNSIQPVGSLWSNSVLVFDSVGLTWDWTQDAAGPLRVIRGGSWGVSAEGLESAYRGGVRPRARDDDLGFRVGDQ